MSFNRMFEFGGLNLWIVASGNGLNLILQFVVAVAASALAAQGNPLSQLLLILGPFFGTALVAFMCGRMERERYMSYGLYTLPGALLVIIWAVLANPVLGIMMVVVAVLGALNGARLAEMTVERHSR